MDNTKRTTGERIDDLLKKNNITNKELSKKVTAAGVKLSAATLSDIINDVDKGYSYKIFVEISKQLNVSTDYLFGLTDIATTDTDIKAICEYTGLNENAIYTLHNNLNEWYKFIFLTINAGTSETILNSKGYNDVTLNEYTKILSDFVSSEQFNKIIKSMFDDAVLLKSTYNDILDIVSGNCERLKAICEDKYYYIGDERFYNDTLYVVNYWENLAKMAHNNQLLKEHRLNIFNIQDYILDYSRNLTDFDKSNFEFVKLSDIFDELDFYFDEAFKPYLKYDEPFGYIDDDFEITEDTTESRKLFTNILIERLRELIEFIKNKSEQNNE